MGILISLLVFLSIVLSIHYLDNTIAVRVMHFLRSIRPLRKATENIPDILPYLVAVGTVIMWLIYIYRLHLKKNDVITQFLLLAAATLPAAYLLKTFFKFMFGRIGPRYWLHRRGSFEFHLFHNFGSGSFPSGHMTVFAAFGVAVLYYFPKYRRPVIILLILLGIALIGTDYHFLSDVIAGAYLGFVTTYSLKFIIEKLSVKDDSLKHE